MDNFSETIDRYITLNGRELYESAQRGERHGGIFRDAEIKTRIRLEKSIASHTAQVAEHADKLRHPEKYDAGWTRKTDRQREGLLIKWKKDLKRNAEQAKIEIEVWKERFDS